MKENKRLVSEVIKDIEHDMTDEEILSLLASSKVSENTSKSAKDEYSFGQRAADKIARFAGSWGLHILICSGADTLDGCEHIIGGRRV